MVMSVLMALALMVLFVWMDNSLRGQSPRELGIQDELRVLRLRLAVVEQRVAVVDLRMKMETATDETALLGELLGVA
jgi:hypothetical protein